MTLCSLTPLYNEFGEHLRRNLNQQEKLGITKAFFGDGIWPFFPDKTKRPDGLSYDGTRELIKEYKFTEIIDCGNLGEIRCINKCLHEIAKQGYDFILQLAADEWIEGDLNRFIENAYESLDEQKNQFFIKFVTHHISPPSQQFDKLARLHYNPTFLRLRHIHWWWYFNNKPIEHGSTIRGLSLHHDDTPRHKKREHQMEIFQKKQAEWETETIERLMKRFVPKPMSVVQKCGCSSNLSFRLVQGCLVGHTENKRCDEHVPVRLRRPRGF